jgi:membrane protein
MKLTDIFHLFRETFRQWREEDITRLGAAIAYYAAFSLLPLLLVTTAIAGVLFGPERAEHDIVEGIHNLIGPQAAQTIRYAVESIGGNPGAQSLTTIFSVLAVLYGATGMFRHLKNALNIIWNVPPRTPSKVRGFIRDTVVSFGFVLGMGVLLLVVLIVNAALLSLVWSLDRAMPEVEHIRLWQAGAALLLFLATLFVFATIYRVLPDAHVRWRDVWVGAAITALLFSLGQLAIGAFLSSSSLDTIYGAASALMFILLWAYLTAHLILLGAEFTQVYANRYGSKIVPQQEHDREKAAALDLNSD